MVGDLQYIGLKGRGGLEHPSLAFSLDITGEEKRRPVPGDPENEGVLIGNFRPGSKSGRWMQSLQAGRAQTPKRAAAGEDHRGRDGPSLS